MKITVKKLVTFALTAAVVATSITTGPTIKANAARTIGMDYAKIATVTTSSNESDELSGQNAIDGTMTTRWSSAFRDGEWIQLDFGKIVEIGGITIHWEAAYAKSFSIVWSQDGTTWNTALTHNCSYYSPETTDMFYNRPVRYIRIICNQRATQYGVSIHEIEACGNAYIDETTTEEETTTAQSTATSEVMNLAQDATATATSIEGTEYAASKAIDGDMNTRWSSSFRDAQSITLDLGSICNVGSVKIFWEAAYAKKYTISWSQDGTTWNVALTKTLSSYSPDTVDMFYNRPVRYIMITSNQRATEYGTSIYEIEVLGTKQIPTPQPTTEVTTCVVPTTEVTTAVETTTVAETTTEEETTTEVTAPVAPLEVIGAVVSTPRDNTVAVVWGQDAERLNSGCKYNVYVNGVKKLDNVVCNYYELTDLGIGNAQVVIKSVLNNVESEGVKFDVTVTGEQAANNVAFGATATATNVFDGNEASNLVDSDPYTVWRAMQMFPQVTVDLGTAQYVKSMEISWLGDYDAPKGFSFYYSNDGENWTMLTNVDKMNYQTLDTVSVNVEARYFLFSMGRYSNLAHFYGARDIKLFN
ncbi:MAG: discoidin domain-containing protein [Eubacterium sp.]|nr:discoidin domain-containing protein [Eubacterium sp.]